MQVTLRDQRVNQPTIYIASYIANQVAVFMVNTIILILKEYR